MQYIQHHRLYAEVVLDFLVVFHFDIQGCKKIIPKIIFFNCNTETQFASMYEVIERNTSNNECRGM